MQVAITGKSDPAQTLLRRSTTPCLTMSSGTLMMRRVTQRLSMHSWLQRVRRPINLDPFRTLPSVQVEGAKNIGRLTNLTNLTRRYQLLRTIPQRRKSRLRGHVRTNREHYKDSIRGLHILSIAQTAAFHFAAVELGGSSHNPWHDEMYKRAVSYGFCLSGSLIRSSSMRCIARAVYEDLCCRPFANPSISSGGPLNCG